MLQSSFPVIRIASNETHWYGLESNYSFRLPEQAAGDSLVYGAFVHRTQKGTEERLVLRVTAQGDDLKPLSFDLLRDGEVAIIPDNVDCGSTDKPRCALRVKLLNLAKGTEHELTIELAKDGRLSRPPRMRTLPPADP